MNTVSLLSRIALLTGLLFGTAVAQAAPDLVLEVIHTSQSIGADGVERSTRLTERVIRRGNTVWVERMMPAGAHSAHAHNKLVTGNIKPAAAKEHKHADLSAASRWIEKDAQGKVHLRLVDPNDKMVVNIAPVEYSNVGFDGSWLAAYHLVDPALLKTLKPSEKSTKTAQWYENKANPAGSRVRVLWDSQLEIPLQVMSAAGLTQRYTQVRVLPATNVQPWVALNGYAQKDFSDFLD